MSKLINSIYLIAMLFCSSFGAYCLGKGEPSLNAGALLIGIVLGILIIINFIVVHEVIRLSRNNNILYKRVQQLDEEEERK